MTGCKSQLELDSSLGRPVICNWLWEAIGLPPLPTPLPAVAPRQQSALPIPPAATLQESAPPSPPPRGDGATGGRTISLGQLAPSVIDMGNGTGLVWRRQQSRRWTTGTRTRPPTVSASTRFSQGLRYLRDDRRRRRIGGWWPLAALSHRHWLWRAVRITMLSRHLGVTAHMDTTCILCEPLGKLD